MNNQAKPPQIQAFLDLLNTRMARKEELKANQTNYRIRNLLETEVAELYVIRSEYTKIFSEFLSKKNETMAKPTFCPEPITTSSFSREKTYMSERMNLIRDVFDCKHCDTLGLAFARRQPDGRFFRFPPVIGATRDAAVLFIGINPRITQSNRTLHQQVSGNITAFKALAANRINGRPYIAVDGEERHYKRHARMINDLFPNQLFEEVAAASELYFCASKDTSGLNRFDYPCAQKFMARVFLLMRPKAVVAVGKPVKEYLQRFRCGSSNAPFFHIRIGGHTTTVIPVPHPNKPGGCSAEWMWATAAVASVLAGQPVVAPQQSIVDASTVATGCPADGVVSDETIIQRYCGWQERYGWKPFQRPVDLDVIETVPGGRIEFHLTRDGETEFILSMTADQWKTALGRYYTGPNWRRNGYAVSLTRRRGGRPVAEFVERWEPYIRRMNDA